MIVNYILIPDKMSEKYNGKFFGDYHHQKSNSITQLICMMKFWYAVFVLPVKTKKRVCSQVC